MHCPALKPREVVKALKKGGSVEKRQVGSHLSLEQPQTGVIVVVPMHRRDLKRGLMMGIIKDAGFTLEEFLKLL